MKLRVYIFPENEERFDALIRKGIPTMSFSVLEKLSEDGELQIITESQRLIDFVRLGQLIAALDYETARSLPPVPGQQRG